MSNLPSYDDLVKDDPRLPIDWADWFKKPAWKVYEAVMLAIGYHPDDARNATHDIDGYLLVCPSTVFPAEYYSLLDAVRDADGIEELRLYKNPDIGVIDLARVRPADFVRWCIGQGVELPEQMRALAAVDQGCNAPQREQAQGAGRQADGPLISVSSAAQRVTEEGLCNSEKYARTKISRAIDKGMLHKIDQAGHVYLDSSEFESWKNSIEPRKSYDPYDIEEPVRKGHIK